VVDAYLQRARSPLLQECIELLGARWKDRTIVISETLGWNHQDIGRRELRPQRRAHIWAGSPVLKPLLCGTRRHLGLFALHSHDASSVFLLLRLLVADHIRRVLQRTLPIWRQRPLNISRTQHRRISWWHVEENL